MLQTSRHKAYLCVVFDRLHTAAFTGHRTYAGDCDDVLDAVLRRLYGRGFRTFISGMAAGFDMAAAQAVLRLRRSHPDVRLVCAIPFRGQAARFAPADAERYDALCRAADVAIYLCEEYDAGCYRRRNDFLVDESSYMVAYYDSSLRGGTCYTVKRARRKGLPVENIYPDPQGSLSL